MRQTDFVKTVLSLAIDAGWSIDAVDNGEYRVRGEGWTPDNAVAHCLAVDESWITLEKHGKRASLFVVWQAPIDSYEEGEEAVTDYSVALEPIMDSAYTFAETHITLSGRIGGFQG